MTWLTVFNFLIGMLAFTLVLVALFNLFDLSAKCKYLCCPKKKCNDSDCCDKVKERCPTPNEDWYVHPLYKCNCKK